MTVQKQSPNRVSLVLSVIAIILALVAMLMPPQEVVAEEDDSYERVVEEVWEIMQPVYADFDVALSEQELEPKTLRNALGPMVRISQALTGGL